SSTLDAPLTYIHSFPTRRSSDLNARRHLEGFWIYYGKLVIIPVGNDDSPIDRVNSNTKRAASDRQPLPYRPSVRIDKDEFLTLRSEEHTSELQSRENLVCRLLLE